jgi:hypothetical protein
MIFGSVVRAAIHGLPVPVVTSLIGDHAIKENKFNGQVVMSEVAKATLVRDAQRDLGIKGR